jgi:predicted kinase
MNIWICRGIPGSGKSTWIKNYHPNGIIFSADNFHINKETGEYKYDVSKSAEAHHWCLRQYNEALIENNSDRTIIVDNTNVRQFEIAPYYKLAEAYGFPVCVMWFLCDPELGIKRNVHNVPAHIIHQMARSFDPLPNWWNVQYITAA